MRNTKPWLVIIGALVACGITGCGEDQSSEMSPMDRIDGQVEDKCKQAIEAVDPSLKLAMHIFTGVPDPRNEPGRTPSFGIDCSVTRPDGSFAQLFVPDEGGEPYLHETDS